MSKKILITTLPQGTNYGGMLQAYALQHVLRGMGYAPETTVTSGPAIRRLLKSLPVLKGFIKMLRGDSKIYDRSNITKYTSRFISDHINIIDIDKAFQKSADREYHAYVTGSDQVWRCLYTYVPHNLLSFTPNDAIKISYAASFGKDNINEYSSGLKRKTRKLAQRLDGVSVREDSAVGLAKAEWGVNALRHVDPTLLPRREDYVELVESCPQPLVDKRGGIFVYVLDKHSSTKNKVKKISELIKGECFEIIESDENSGNPLPPVEQWIKSFMDAKYVITDSFHGTVFSIIFNKPFIAIGNEGRGLARFTSLLKMFGLEDRLVTSADEVTEELINKPIDWKSVSAKIKAEQKRSFEYLKKHLG